MSLPLESLDEVSRDFVAYLAEHEPGWLGYGKAVPNDGSSSHFVWIEFPNPPSTEGEEPLWISTEDNEITIGIGAHHAHLPWPKSYFGDDGRPAVMEHVGDLIGEKMIIVSIWEDGRLVGSSSLPPEFAKNLLELPGGPHELRIRSWRGTYNKTLRSNWDTYLQLINDHHSSVFGRASEP